MDKLYVALAALGGGLAAALLGWLESRKKFDGRKFGGSAVRALVAAFGFAAGYALTEAAGLPDLMYAFLGGAGVDVIGNRIAGRLGNGSFPVPSDDKTETADPEPGNAEMRGSETGGREA